MSAASRVRELRVCGMYSNGLAQYQIGRWRKHGPLLVQEGGCVVVEEWELPALIRGITDARKMMKTIRGSTEE